jgi:hypothetical protein
MTTNDDKTPRQIQNERQHTAYTRPIDCSTSRRHQMKTHQKVTTDRTKNKGQEKHKTQNTKHKTQNTKHKTQNTKKHRTQILNFGSNFLSPNDNFQ